MSIEKKVCLAGYVIRIDGTVAHRDRQIGELFDRLANRQSTAANQDVGP